MEPTYVKNLLILNMDCLRIPTRKEIICLLIKVFHLYENVGPLVAVLITLVVLSYDRQGNL